MAISPQEPISPPTSLSLLHVLNTCTTFVRLIIWPLWSLIFTQIIVVLFRVVPCQDTIDPRYCAFGYSLTEFRVFKSYWTTLIVGNFLLSVTFLTTVLRVYHWIHLQGYLNAFSWNTLHRSPQPSHLAVLRKNLPRLRWSMCPNFQNSPILTSTTGNKANFNFLRLPIDLQHMVLEHYMQEMSTWTALSSNLEEAFKLFRALEPCPNLRDEALRIYFWRAPLYLDLETYQPLGQNHLLLSNLNYIKTTTVSLG